MSSTRRDWLSSLRVGDVVLCCLVGDPATGPLERGIVESRDREKCEHTVRFGDDTWEFTNGVMCGYPERKLEPAARGGSSR